MKTRAGLLALLGLACSAGPPSALSPDRAPSTPQVELALLSTAPDREAELGLRTLGATVDMIDQSGLPVPENLAEAVRTGEPDVFFDNPHINVGRFFVAG